MSFTDLLKSPLGIAGIVGSLALGGGTVIYVVKETPPVSSSSSTTAAPKDNAGAFPMKFVVEYEKGSVKSQFDCDLSLDYTCFGPGKRLFLALHAADHSKVTVIWRIDLARSVDSDWNLKRGGVSWSEMSDGIYLDAQKEHFVQARPS